VRGLGAAAPAHMTAAVSYALIDAAEPLGDGTLRTPRLDAAEAYRRYARF